MIVLHILNGPGRGESYELKMDSVHVGRSPDNDLQLNDILVSRRHLKISRKKKKYYVQDLKSTNGTFVGGEQIRSGIEYEVGEGLPIAIGISLICLGEKCSEKVLAFLDTFGRSEEIGEKDTAFTKEKRLRPEKNIELFYKVSNVLMQSMDVDEIAEKMLGYLFDLLKRIDRGAIILVDHETGSIERVVPRLRKPSDATFMMYSRAVVDRVIREGKALLMPDTHGEDEADRSVSMELMKIRSVLCVPLICRSQINGVIYLDSIKTPYGFRKEDLSLVKALGIPAAVAIEQALLHSNEKARKKD
ncbi:MAG: FHA domain-containing protein [Desulfobacteraceae bacterium]|nr:FHA domain-containing protein [Desulfobacteraceae bacterium]